ncbi:alpha/beta hydrolase family esterase [Thalassotalea piscium]
MRLLLKTMLLSTFFALSLYPQYAAANFKAVADFGENPGELSASYFTNKKTSNNLVVLLHGCVQNGEELAKQSGFLGQAESQNFALLIPQQNQNNNIKTCFNWFSAQDTDKDKGESLSLKNIINHVKDEVQAKHIYIVGLSAGGAMASAMIVNYPNMFESGAIIAGVPYPCADNLIKAISCMRTGPSQSAKELTELVKQTNEKQGHWPSLTIWTGTADKVVNSANSTVLAQHWAMLTQANSKETLSTEEGYQISRWNNDKGLPLVTLVEIDGMGHGIPVNPQKNNGGIEAPFVLKAPISAALHITKHWNLN